MSIYEEVSTSLDEAYEVATKEKARLNLNTQQEFAYGEIAPVYFIPVINYAQPKPGEVFYDLGCGAGKPLLTASIAFPELKVCRGIELLEGLTKMA